MFLSLLSSKPIIFIGITAFYSIWINSILKKLFIMLFKWERLHRQLIHTPHRKHSVTYSLLLETGSHMA